jgi:hypothetical protein
MRGSAWRYFGSLIGFGFGAVWMTAGLGSAVLSLLCAAFGYGATIALERRRPAGRTKARPRQTRRIDVETMPVVAEPGW